MNAPQTIRSCAGPSLCREDVLGTVTQDALADVEEACARHGGTFGARACAREGAAAKCSAGTEHGVTSVFAYARTSDAGKIADVVARASEQCEALEGAFEALIAQAP